MKHPTIKTKLHVYHYDLNKPDQAAKYAAMCKRLSGRKCLKMWGGEASGQALESGPVELETEFIFDDQWNTATHRVFDWFEDACPSLSRSFKRGHWLEITKEMREIRQSVLRCGYCGKHYRNMKGKAKFCSACLHSEYLKETDLHLLRLLPAGASFGGKRDPLTDSESAELMPRYLEAQVRGKAETEQRALESDRKRIERELAESKRKIELAQDEYDGKRWLLDRGFRIDNVIFYTHTGRFCFGWQRPIGPELKSRMLDVLSEFPFDYDFKEEKTSGTA